MQTLKIMGKFKFIFKILTKQVVMKKNLAEEFKKCI